MHTVWVSDLEAGTWFFTDTIGLTELRSHTRSGITNVYIGSRHEAVQLRYESGRSVSPPERNRMDHVAIAVDESQTCRICEKVTQSSQYELIQPPELIEMLNVEVAFINSPKGILSNS